jgi:hypothetical protein
MVSHREEAVGSNVRRIIVNRVFEVLSSESDSRSLAVHKVIFLMKDLDVCRVADYLRDSSVLTKNAAGLGLKVAKTLSPASFAFQRIQDELSFWEVKGPIWGPLRLIMNAM